MPESITIRPEEPSATTAPQFEYAQLAESPGHARGLVFFAHANYLVGRLDPEYCTMSSSSDRAVRQGDRQSPEAAKDADDDAVRAYVSHLWATDWDSDSDAIYDER